MWGVLINKHYIQVIYFDITIDLLAAVNVGAEPTQVSRVLRSGPIKVSSCPPQIAPEIGVSPLTKIEGNQTTPSFAPKVSFSLALIAEKGAKINMRRFARHIKKFISLYPIEVCTLIYLFISLPCASIIKNHVFIFKSDS
jgi:hypothetical protein